MDWSYLFLSFEGRISRQPFWVAFLIVSAVERACHLLVLPLEDSQRISSIISLVFVYPEFAVFAKRGHDRNISPRIIAVFFALAVLMDFVTMIGLGGTKEHPSTLMMTLAVPLLLFALVLLIELGMRRGTQGPNRYGPDPLA